MSEWVRKRTVFCLFMMAVAAASAVHDWARGGWWLLVVLDLAAAMSFLTLAVISEIDPGEAR